MTHIKPSVQAHTQTDTEKKTINQPHDKLCKKAMENPKVAIEFFETHLPTDLLALLDLASLQPVKETFITPLFENRAPDFIYQAKFKAFDNVLFLLCEQQKNIDNDIAFRFLSNTCLLMDRHKKQHPKQPWPLVYPILIYNGPKKWTAPKDIFGLFGKQEELARTLFLKPYCFIDVCRVPDETLRQHRFSGIMEFALKYGEMRREEAFYDVLLPWMKELVETDGARAMLLCEDVFLYLVREMRHVTPDEYEALLIKSRTYLPNQLQEKIMNMAHYIKQEGRIEGRMEGKIEGKMEGKQEGYEEAMQKMAKELLQEKVLPLEKIAHITGLSIKALHALQVSHKKHIH